MKRLGRGVDFSFYVSPKLRNEDEEKMFSLLYEIKTFKENFSVNVIDSKDDGERIRLHSFRANFVLDEEEYNDIYCMILYEILTEAFKIIKTFGYKIKGYYFGIVWLIPEPKNIIPMYKLEIPKELSKYLEDEMER